jgi:hypothetical protein
MDHAAWGTMIFSIGYAMLKSYHLAQTAYLIVALVAAFSSAMDRLNPRMEAL